ncbi:phosphonate ABC transporter permease subunit PhnE [Thermosporothrix hazakensis]|uniref:Phosphonate ABC transporter permease subunit PhnE n=1 Tax=Thermosporothrix hazakensis TaxID=644383 RepID=A0A326UB83_THEHA|nr:phosphonate ABC transporter, permease protein PhnE [Thermosporothrix hazakensis]PZW32938.1 phosphonate ABC transporter permease subunit PhnE [Thermosporothrix hazakensis]GCE48970.1 hypothetical protein KTH_38390 [Thermosporothrix hazakensis]
MAIERNLKSGQATDPRLQKRYDFFQRFQHSPDRTLIHPLQIPKWSLTLPALLCALGIVLLAQHLISLGTYTVNWTIAFDLNSAVAILILVTGAVSMALKARHNLKELRSTQSIISLVVLLALAGFFFARVLNVGTFTYTLQTLDSNFLVSLLLACGLVFLAFRGSKFASGILFGLFIWWGFNIKDFDWLNALQGLFSSSAGAKLVKELLPPDWTYFGNILDALAITIQTAIVATILGVIGALPLSILAARNTSPHPIIYNTIRLLMNATRAIPSLVMALLFVPFLGLGPGAGIMGLGIHTISSLTKLYAEAIEAVKPQPIEALTSVGANGFKRFRWGVLPQAFPLLASYTIYAWESNGRDSTVVAFVGGGGLGFLLQANLSLFEYANVSVIIIVLVITVMLLDRLSDFVRSKII